MKTFNNLIVGLKSKKSDTPDFWEENGLLNYVVPGYWVQKKIEYQQGNFNNIRPKLPKFTGTEKLVISNIESLFKTNIEKFVASDSLRSAVIRPALQGIFFSNKYTVATNSHILLRHNKVTSNIDIILPLPGYRILKKLYKLKTHVALTVLSYKFKTKKGLWASNWYLRAVTGDYTVHIKLIDESYPATANHIPDAPYPNRMNISNFEISELKATLKSFDVKTTRHLVFDSSKNKVTAKNVNQDITIGAYLPFMYSDLIGLGLNYLKIVLSNFKTADIVRNSSPLRPQVFYTKDLDLLIMPVNLPVKLEV